MASVMRRWITAAAGLAIGASTLVMAGAPAAHAAVTPVTTVHALSGAWIKVSDDHFHPGDTISITGGGFVTEPHDPNQPPPPGNPVLAVKVNATTYEGTGFPWEAGGPSRVDPDDLPTSGTSDGYEAFEIVGGAFSGTITIPADWDVDSQPSWFLTFLGGSLSTAEGGQVLTPIPIDVPLTLLDPDEPLAAVTSVAHTPGSNNNKTLAVKLRNYQRAGGAGGQKLALSIPGSSYATTCVQTDADGDANASIDLGSVPGTLQAGANALQVSAGVDCDSPAVAQPPTRTETLPFIVTTATIESTQHVPGGSLRIALKSFLRGGVYGGQRVAFKVDATQANDTPQIACVTTDVQGNAVSDIPLPAGLTVGTHTLNVLVGTACGLAAGSDAPARSISLPFEVSELAPLQATNAARITGTSRVGGRLSAVAPTFSQASGVSLTYAWLRNGVVIPGATRSSYSATPADAGRRLSVRVVGTHALAGTATSVSAATAPVAKGVLARKAKPRITGTAKRGKTLKVSRGSWTPSGFSVSYRWTRNGKAIKGANKARYKVKKSDRGRTIRVVVTVKKAGYATAKVTTAGKKVSRK